MVFLNFNSNEKNIKIQWKKCNLKITPTRKIIKESFGDEFIESFRGWQKVFDIFELSGGAINRD